MYIVTLLATEVVLLRKLGKNEVELSKEPHYAQLQPHSQPNFYNKTTSVTICYKYLSLTLLPHFKEVEFLGAPSFIFELFQASHNRYSCNI
jgi:hypothetical protein